MRRKFVWLVVSCLMALSLVLASCGAPAPQTASEETVAPTTEVTPKTTEAAKPTADLVKDSLGRMVEKPRYGGVMTWVPLYVINGHDPAFTFPGNMLTEQTHERLMGLDWLRSPQGSNEFSAMFSTVSTTFKTGLLAESWEIPDDQTVIYHIRKGVHFALNTKSEASRLVGGREIDANDVVYSINRAFADIPGGYGRIRWQPYEWPVSVTATDKWTVVVKSKPGFLDAVVLATGDFNAPIIAREVVEKYGDLRDWKNNVGAGPFMLTDYVHGSSATFVRNPDYWMKDPFHPENQLPYLDGVKYLWIDDASTRQAALRAGKLDTLSSKWGLSKDDWENVKRTNPELKSNKVIGYWDEISFRINRPEIATYDVRVRQALAMAIDREAIVRDYFDGDAEMHTGPVGPIAEYGEGRTPLDKLPAAVQELYKYQPDKARKLLADAGFPKGFKITIDTPNVGTDLDLLEAVSAYWKDIGVELNIAVHDQTVQTSMQQNRAIMEASYGQGNPGVPYLMKGWQGEDPSNMGKIVDPVIDAHALVIAANYVRNEKVAQAELAKFAPYVLEKVYRLYLPANYDYTPYQPWIKRFSGEVSTGYVHWQTPSRYVWIDQDLKQKMTGLR